MHWVDRGPEPAGLVSVRSQHTQGWIDYCQGNMNRRPSPRWIQFRGVLEQVFLGLCAYCEEETPGEIDHFQPVSKFPQFVYVWSNWVFSCHSCNHSKLNKWPCDGYINPCTEIEAERPEHFVGFDTKSGALTPRKAIPSQQQRKTTRTIEDFGLNDFFHLKRRKTWLDALRHHLEHTGVDLDEEQDFLSRVVDRSSPLSSITRALLDEMGFEIED